MDEHSFITPLNIASFCTHCLKIINERNPAASNVLKWKPVRETAIVTYDVCSTSSMMNQSAVYGRLISFLPKPGTK